MPRYYFHIFNSTSTVEDEEGLELPDLQAARAQAITGIRSVLSTEILTGVFDLRGRIDIADAEGKVVETVRYKEALEMSLGEYGS
jgi:hypothetical protein